MQTSGCEILK